MTITIPTNDAGLIVREVAVRAAGEGAAMTFTGLAVPWNDPIDLYGDGSWVEDVARGAVQDSDSAKVFYRHGEIIGHITAYRDIDAGWEIDGLIADTTLGRDAYALLKAGSISKLSIGFIPLEWTRAEDGAITYTKIQVREVSLVPHPAYDAAEISVVRTAPTPKGPTLEPVTDTVTRADLQPFTDGMESMERAIAKMAVANTTPAPAIPHFRSMGEFVRAAAEGDEAALELHRAFTGGTLADAIVKDSWIGDYTKLVEKRRRTMNQFATGTLPEKGMTIEYGQLKADETAVGEQTAEGEDLTKSGNVSLETKNAPVHTDGGWAEQSVQSIKRATIATLETTQKALLMKYAQRTEARALAAYLATITANTEASPLTIAADADANDWLDLLVDAALEFEDRGFSLDGLNVSVDQFKRLNRLTDGDGRRLMNVWGTGSNQIGELNLSSVSGALASVPVTLLGTKSTTQTAAFYDAEAMQVLESSGAPIQLQDSNIINLTESFSMYGHTAVLTPFPSAIIPVKLGI